MPRSSDGHRQVIVMGAQIDLELLKVEANAHHKAIDCIRGPNGRTRGRLGWDWDGVNATLGHVLSQYLRRQSRLYSSVSSFTHWC